MMVSEKDNALIARQNPNPTTIIKRHGINHKSVLSHLRNVTNSAEGLNYKKDKSESIDIKSYTINGDGTNPHRRFSLLLREGNVEQIRDDVMAQLSVKSSKEIANRLLIGSISINKMAFPLLNYIKERKYGISDMTLKAVLNAGRQDIDMHKEIIKMASPEQFTKIMDGYKSQCVTGDRKASDLESFNMLLKNRNESPKNITELRDPQGRGLLEFFKRKNLNHLSEVINRAKDA